MCIYVSLYVCICVCVYSVSIKNLSRPASKKQEVSINFGSLLCPVGSWSNFFLRSPCGWQMDVLLS